jgi:hypothetical protein
VWQELLHFYQKGGISQQEFLSSFKLANKKKILAAVITNTGGCNYRTF